MSNLPFESESRPSLLQEVKLLIYISFVHLWIPEKRHLINAESLAPYIDINRNNNENN
jgi:hypothetical protein